MMPRIRQLAGRYSDQDFVLHLKTRMLEQGYTRGMLELSERTGIPYRTLLNRVEHPEKMTVSNIRALYKALSLDSLVIVNLIEQKIAGKAVNWKETERSE